MSAATVPVQQATIRQYAKRLQLVTMAGQFATVADQAIKEKQSHLSYLEVLLGMEVKSENATRWRGASRMRTFLK